MQKFYQAEIMSRQVALGIDIGGTDTKYGFVEKSGEILSKGKFSTNTNDDIIFFIADLKKEIKKALAALPEQIELIGIGIGAPNGNFYRGTIEQATNLAWKGIVPLSRLVEESLNAKTFVTNDANAAAMGEMLFGSAKGMRNFVVITMGTGLGSGIVVNGEIVYGHSGFAGELGHQTVNINGRSCACGKKGCLETYVSATGIKRTVYKLLADSREESVLRNIGFNDLSAEMITGEALRGDKIATEAFEYTGRILGIKLADTVYHLAPEAIFLAGGLAKAGSILFDQVIFQLEKNLMTLFKDSVKVLPSGLEDQDSSILGAASLILK